MNKAHATGLEQRETRTKRNAARDLRTVNEEKEAAHESASMARRNSLAVSAALIPPYCYHQHGMTAEQGAAEAVKALRITLAIEALGLLWQMRRVAADSVFNHAAQAVPERKV